MLDRSSTVAAAVALAAALMVAIGGAQAADDMKYPDWRGQWIRIPVRLPTQPSHDQTKPWGKGQEAPLIPEYQAILEASIADQAQGGLGNFPTTTGRAAGMPHMMMGFIPMEFVVTPDTTYVLIGMIPSRASHASSTGSNRSAAGSPRAWSNAPVHSG